MDEITLIGVEDSDNEDLNRLLWDTELGDLLVGAAHYSVGMVHGTRGACGCDGSLRSPLTSGSVRYRLDDAQTIEYDYWILDDPVASVLDQTTRVM